jgi:glucose/arabinose dehydrogenase
MKRRRFAVYLLAGLIFIPFLFYLSCFRMRPSRGGGQTDAVSQRRVDISDVALPQGYTIERVAEGLSFPTGVTFDEQGTPYVVESGYSYGEVFSTPRLVKIQPGSGLQEIVRGGKNGPWNGVQFYAGNVYVAEGGVMEGGKILRISSNGQVHELVTNLPSQGDHHTNGPLVAPDGYIYFGQGVATNSGVVGEDSAKFGWLKRFPKLHDVPCQDVTLTGHNFETADFLNPDQERRVKTGAFSPFGTETSAGQSVKGSVPCNGAIMRIKMDGGAPELYAWGFRNPFGFALSPEGKLYATDNGYDVRGSRPVFGTADFLWEVKQNTWYGWPDYSGSLPLTDDFFEQGDVPALNFLLKEHPNRPPEPVASFGVHSSSNGFDFSRSSDFGHVGEAFVAQFGDMAPGVGKTLHPVGFKIVRVDVTQGIIQDFAVNKGKKNGPASRTGGNGLERPVAARFNPSGNALYVVDFGVMTIGESPRPQLKTGVLWKITRSR